MDLPQPYLSFNGLTSSRNVDVAIFLLIKNNGFCSVSYLPTLPGLYLQQVFSFLRKHLAGLSYGILEANSGALRGARLEGKGWRIVLSSI